MLPMGNVEMVIFYTTFIHMGVMYLHARTFVTFADTTSIPMGAMYLHATTFWTLTHMTSIPMGVIYLHARTFCTLAHTTSIPVGGMYLHARTFWKLAYMTSIPVGAMYLHARTFCTLSDMILYPWWAPIFTVITDSWPHANRAMVTNNSTVIIEVMLINVVLIKSFLYYCTNYTIKSRGVWKF